MRQPQRDDALLVALMLIAVVAVTLVLTRSEAWEKSTQHQTEER